MTVKTRLVEMCKRKGMDEDTAIKVVNLSIAKIKLRVKGYDWKWNDPVTQFPEKLYDAMFSTVKAVARKWIEENRPDAWFRGEFE